MLSPAGNALLAVAGTAVVLLAMLDLVWTTMSLRRAGPVTRAVMDAVWSALRGVSRRRGSRRMLVPVGPVLLFGSLLGWVLMLWVGWGMIFMAGPDAVLVTPERTPGNFTDRVYFTGFTISTLGVGDVVPSDGVWQLLTAIAATSGLIAITVGITYVLAVVSAAVQMRQLACYISSLGSTPEEMLIRGWDGTGFAPLTAHLQSLTPVLLTVMQQHLAYPVLRYFSTTWSAAAIAPTVAMLDEVVTLLRHGVAPPLRPHPLSLRPIRAGIEGIIGDISPVELVPAEESPPSPKLPRLAEAGIGVVPEAEFESVLAQEDERRRALHRILRHEGWEWQPVSDRGWPRRSG